MEKSALYERPRRLLGATPPPAPTGRKRPSARASRSHPASPRGLQPLGLRPHPKSWPPKGAGWPPKTGQRMGDKQAHQVRHPLPSPPPLPAGKGSESPSVVRGAGRAALRLLLLPPAGERGVVPRASRVRFASILTRSVLGLRPALRMRLPVEPLTPFPLQQPPDQMRATGRDAIFWASVRVGVSGRDLWPWRASYAVTAAIWLLSLV